MRIASIDIGTNTILMLVADIGRDGLHVVRDNQLIARLGQGVDDHRRIHPLAVDRLLNALRQHLEIAAEEKVKHVIVTGTSALRDAGNRDDVISRVQATFGLNLELLSGEDEARWSYAGSVSDLYRDDEYYAVLDIGGGSTELTLGQGLNVTNKVSIDIGCVRMTEKFLKHAPPLAEEIESLHRYVRAEIQKFPPFDPARHRLIGVAGTVTTLAAMALNLSVYDGKAVAGHKLTVKTVRHRFDQLKTLTYNEILGIMQIDPGRADIITAGILILLNFMEMRSISEILVSDRGLRYGIVLREMERLQGSIL